MDDVSVDVRQPEVSSLMTVCQPVARKTAQTTQPYSIVRAALKGGDRVRREHETVASEPRIIHAHWSKESTILRHRRRANITDRTVEFFFLFEHNLKIACFSQGASARTQLSERIFA